MERPPELSTNALRILESRYLRRNSSGIIDETPAQLFQRVAKAVAQAELQWGTASDVAKWEEQFTEATSTFRFLPNSPTLMNAGMPASQLSACFVLPVDDHLPDIFDTLKLSALIQQSGGGTGFNFSHLRPRNDVLHNTQGTASGPVSFMKIFDAATEHIKQGGKRRGANMGVLNIDHPDIEEFISCKQTEGDIRNFNISVAMTDPFMHALDRDEPWSLLHPNTGRIVKRVKARDLWQNILENAWSRGDPGLLFIDTINAANPTPALGRIEATNPCGEVPLLPYEACNLGSINLSRFIVENSTGKKQIDWISLDQMVTLAIRFLDNVIEVNRYPSQRIREAVLGNRKIGLGVMGWAETLCKLGLPYESVEAVDLARRVMKSISEKSAQASILLARERGSFINWRDSIYYPHTPMRNATRTSIAPTGTISIIADTSSSIEPFFALAYQRKHVLHDDVLQELNHDLLYFLARNPWLDKTSVIEQVKEHGTLENIDSIPPQVKNIFKTALEIAPEWHLRHQAAFQQYTDNAVSKTINLPQRAGVADIDLIYRRAWTEKLKGITVFRNNSRKTQVIHRGIASDINACKVCIE